MTQIVGPDLLLKCVAHFMCCNFDLNCATENSCLWKTQNCHVICFLWHSKSIKSICKNDSVFCICVVSVFFFFYSILTFELLWCTCRTRGRLDWGKTLFKTKRGILGKETATAGEKEENCFWQVISSSDSHKHDNDSKAFFFFSSLEIFIFSNL